MADYLFVPQNILAKWADTLVAPGTGKGGNPDKR